MAIINYYAVPATCQALLIGTSCTETLLTSCYAPSTGAGRGMLANRAFISLEGANIRYTLNGTAPTEPPDPFGHVFVAGDYMSLDDVAQMQNLQLLNQSGTATAYLQVTYFMG